MLAGRRMLRHLAPGHAQTCARPSCASRRARSTGVIVHNDQAVQTGFKTLRNVLNILDLIIAAATKTVSPLMINLSPEQSVRSFMLPEIMRRRQPVSPARPPDLPSES